MHSRSEPVPVSVSLSPNFRTPTFRVILAFLLGRSLAPFTESTTLPTILLSPVRFRRPSCTEDSEKGFSKSLFFNWCLSVSLAVLSPHLLNPEYVHKLTASRSSDCIPLSPPNKNIQISPCSSPRSTQCYRRGTRGSQQSDGFHRSNQHARGDSPSGRAGVYTT